MSVSVQRHDFDISAEITDLYAGNTKVGAIASFIGLVRDMNDGLNVTEIELEHYPSMTQKCLESIVQQAEKRWDLNGVRIIHRFGTLKPADQIVLVIASSSHRSDAFEACEFLMDYLKTQAPFWKKESTEVGERWVEARKSDDEAASRWNSS